MHCKFGVGSTSSFGSQEEFTGRAWPAPMFKGTAVPAVGGAEPAVVLARYIIFFRFYNIRKILKIGRRQLIN